MEFIVAALPIVLTLGLLATRAPAWVAPLAGVVTAIVVALTVLQTPGEQLIEGWNSTTVTLVKVLAIIGGGVFLSRVMDRTGAQKQLASWLAASGPTVPAALLMSHGVVPFFETTTGFGVAVIIGLPLLLSFGFTPYRASVLTLVGLMIGPWGSMGPGTLVGAQAASVSLTDLGIASGVVSGLTFLVSGIAAAIVAGRGHASTALGSGPDHHTISVGDYLKWTLLGAGSAMVLWALVLSANTLLGTPVAGATATMVMSILWLLIIRRGKLLPGPGKGLIPYVALLVGTMTGQFLASWVKDSSAGWLAGVLASPALWSFSAAFLGLAIHRLAPGVRAQLPWESLVMWWQTAIPTALYVLLGAVMSAGGLADELAGAFTAWGPVYLLFMPFVAGLSGFITASGTGANAMVGSTQVAAAHALNVSPLWTMAVQNTAAGWAIIASPARVELSYRLAIAKQSPQTPGPELSRANLYRATIPLVLLCLALWGIGSVLLLPLTSP